MEWVPRLLYYSYILRLHQMILFLAMATAPRSLRISVWTGAVLSVKTDLTVQNGKGIIRSGDGTQQKKLTVVLAINTILGGGETKSFPITWPEFFNGNPDVFVGNILPGLSGWAEIIHTISGVSSNAASLSIYNPKAVTVNLIYSIKIIAIGPQ